MRRSRIEFSIQLASLTAMLTLAFSPGNGFAQLQGVKPSLNRGLGDLNGQLESQAKPYAITSRFHLMEGTTSGYLVVQVDLGPGSHMYSLSQAGAINPTKIQVVPSDAFFIDGKFSPDRPADVIEKDPVFNQRVELHKGKVQFFVPVKFNSVEAISDTQPEIVFNGQVCSTEGVCLPIRDKRIKAEFGGFFGRTVELPATAETPALR